MSSRHYSLERANHITVLPSNINLPTYIVTRIKAQQMVARGQAKWIAGMRRLRELNTRARGIGLEWRPKESAGYSVMQLVPPRPTTSRKARAVSGLL